MLYRMPEDLSEEEEKLSARIHVVKDKTSSMKKGLTKQKNGLAARKKEVVSQTLKPPTDLMTFLDSDDVFDKVLEAAEQDIKSILVRR